MMVDRVSLLHCGENALAERLSGVIEAKRCTVLSEVSARKYWREGWEAGGTGCQRNREKSV
jgi:hypothetical protein